MVEKEFKGGGKNSTFSRGGRAYTYVRDLGKKKGWEKSDTNIGRSDRKSAVTKKTKKTGEGMR